jgi:hypothetical protein
MNGEVEKVKMTKKTKATELKKSRFTSQAWIDN